ARWAVACVLGVRGADTHRQSCAIPHTPTGLRCPMPHDRHLPIALAIGSLPPGGNRPSGPSLLQNHRTIYRNIYRRTAKRRRRVVSPSPTTSDTIWPNGGPQMADYSRRNFLKTGLAAGVLVGSGSLPLRAARRASTDWVTLGKSGVQVTRL